MWIPPTSTTPGTFGLIVFIGTCVFCRITAADRLSSSMDGCGTGIINQVYKDYLLELSYCIRKYQANNQNTCQRALVAAANIHNTDNTYRTSRNRRFGNVARMSFCRETQTAHAEHAPKRRTNRKSYRRNCSSHWLLPKKEFI